MNHIVQVIVQASPHRLYCHAPCFVTRIFNTEQMFYAIRNSHFDGAYRQYMGYFPGSADTEETREQAICSLARGLFVAECGGNA